ncbi:MULTISPECIES: hypothetical protein [unclassified Streptomyces]|uniref:hypothetical protein n=1 Tax=unclassified Streptomyces TaxID=2593676 RepID=UPI0007002624|nr:MULTISPECIES: hypothetical protein [unclassified Streptomyces]KQX53065.1 hypothetical protein ASD33_07530 [Streptomyces sp. Root1304]KRA89986.1 hypothetical protein ASE09_07535 [Streptomyces sp. Root66D1]
MGSVKFDVRRIGAGLATAGLTVVASTACGTSGPPVVTPKAVRHSELVGRWDGTGECGSPVIRLRDDYTFSARDVPVAWDGPGPDSEVTRGSGDGEWHGVNKDPGLTPYLVLSFGDRNDIQTLPFVLKQGELWMSGDIAADGGDPYILDCAYRRTSADPGFGR